MMKTKKISGIKEIAHLYNNFFFDLDGVVWRGHESIEGSLEAMKYLREMNKRMFFVTNSSVRDRIQLKKRFRQYGLEVELDECYPSSYISGLYIREKYPEIKNIMAFGTNMLVNELEASGLNVRRIVDLPGDIQQPIDIKDKYMDETCQGIVVGWDINMSFLKQCLISFHVQRGVKFFGTNPDKHTSIGGMKVPGCGSILASIEMSCGFKAEIMGKPNTFILDKIIAQHQLDKSESIMIGDNTETDIIFGNSAGISTLCLLSGVTKENDLFDKEGLSQPTLYCESLRL